MAPEVLSRRRAWTLVLVATFTMTISYVDRQTLAVLAPTVTRALRISETNYGWLTSAFALAYLVGAPLAGLWIDRVGARRGLVGAVLTWSLVAALHAVAPGFGVLVGLRIALGLAEAPSFPGAAQTVHRVLPARDRARGFGVLFTGSSIGAMIAPPLAVALMHAVGWRGAFVGTALVGLLWLPAWFLVAYTPTGRRALAAPAAGSAAAERPGVWVLARHPAVVRAMLVVLAAAPMNSFVLSWGAKYLVRHYRLTQDQVGGYLWLPPLLFDVGAVVFGDLATRRLRAGVVREGSDRALVAGALVLALALVAMPFAATPWASVALGGVALAGGGALYALATSDMLARVPAGAVSAAGGLTAAAQSVAQIVSSPLVGRGVERLGSYTWIVVALGLWVIPGCLAWLAWKPPPRTTG